MRKNVIISIFAAAVALCSVSCTDWLTVESEDRIMEDGIFSREEGFFTTLNGVYIDLLNANLYNGRLTFTLSDVMAQYYGIDLLGSHTFRNLAAFEAQAKKTAVSESWKRAYFLIQNCNIILEHCESDRGNLRDMSYAVVKGEALALRALLHFEMFRIFGPIYGLDPGQECIPYLDVPEPKVMPLLTAREVRDRILGDLKDAADLLYPVDPVRTQGKLDSDDGNNRYRYRNMRLNYFAVKALSARACLYFGMKPEALAHAGEVIRDGAQFFPFSTRKQVTGQAAAGFVQQASEDRILSSDILFAVYNQKRDVDVYQKLYSNDLELKDLLTLTENGYRNLYPEEGDLRTYQWQSMRDAEGNYGRFFVKYKEVTYGDYHYASMIPVIRMSEVYLIAAECETNTTQAYKHLNDLRLARKTSSVANNLALYIEDEYVREFIGEGQLFWYYKRKNMGQIPSIFDRSKPDKTMNKAFYLFDLPEDENGHRD